MPTPHQEARAIVEQMYSAVGLARAHHVPPIDADGLLVWAAVLDAYLTLHDADDPQPRALLLTEGES
jgi:hypothetical protein